MRSLLLTLFALFTGFLSYSQLHTDSSFDSLIKKEIVFSFEFPRCKSCSSTGILLIRLYEFNGSLKIKTLYSSSNGYIFENYERMIKNLNTKLLNKVTKDFNVVIPICVYFDNDGQMIYPSMQAQKELVRKIKKLNNKIRVLSTVVITWYPPVH